MQVTAEIVRKNMEELGDDQLRLVVTVDAADYAQEAIGIAHQELARRGITIVPEEVKAAVYERSLQMPVAWLRFYPWALLLTVPLSIGEVLQNYRPSTGVLALSLLALSLDVVRVLLFVGLRRRRLWAWQLNWIYLSLAILLCLLAMRIPLIIWACGWGIANYIYFKKRRHLFS